MYACIRVRELICIYIYMYMYIPVICIYIPAYVYIHIYIHIHMSVYHMCTYLYIQSSTPTEKASFGSALQVLGGARFAAAACTTQFPSS